MQSRSGLSILAIKNASTSEVNLETAKPGLAAVTAALNLRLMN